MGPLSLCRPLLVCAAVLCLIAATLPAVAASKKDVAAKIDDSAIVQPITVGKNNTLVCVQVVSRHGTRAPNPVVSKLCPADRANLALYAHLRITLAGLTGTGMSELYDMGVFTRQQYIERTYPGFLSSFFNDQEVYFRAVGEDRTLQSAAAMGQGMFPEGTVPIGYRSDVPSPVPVYTLPDVYDSLLEVRKQGCKAQLAKDAAIWDETKGVALYKANQPLLGRLHQLCNITDLNDSAAGSGDNYGDAIKDITDAWTFDMIEGFKMQDGINVTSLLEFRTLAVEQLLGRIVGTDEQITYMNGELPERMLDNFLFAVWNQGPEHVAEFALKLYAYHGHREMMYALGAFLGIEFDIKFPALPKGGIPPATTLFFELHYLGERDEDGNIPNAFTAAGLENPYEGEGENADALSDKSLPWELRRRSGSDVVKSQTKQHEEPPKRNAPQPSAESEQKVTPSPLAKTALFGSDELSNGHGAPFNFTTPAGSKRNNATGEEEEPNVVAPVSSESAPTPAEEFKYLPRSAQRRVSGTAPAVPARKKKAASWKPAPPTDGYVVRALLWHPCSDDEKDAPKASDADVKKANKKGKKGSKTSRPDSPDCPAVPVAMTTVCDRPAEVGCTLAELSDAIHVRLQRTGTWDQLCHANDVRRIMADEEGLRHAAKRMTLPAVVSEDDEEPRQLTPRQQQLRRQRLRREREQRIAEEAQEEEEAEADAEAEAEAEQERAASARRRPSAPRASTSSEKESSTSEPTPPPSHPILRTFLFLLLAAPLCLLSYVLYIRYRQNDYQNVNGSAGRVPDIEVQQARDEERRPFVH